MRKGKSVWGLVLGMAALVCWTPVWADVVSEKREAQNRLLALRAARADAIRRLAERIHGLTITSGTTVRDFVAESDDIEATMMAFLNGMREVGKPKFMDDGTCEVVMEVTLQELIVTLKTAYRRHYDSQRGKIKIEDFEKMRIATQAKVIRETGSGLPRPELMEEPLSPVQGASTVSASHLTGKAKAYWKARCTPRGRLMALRAARVDGMRRLAERIKGVTITSDTSVRDFVAESDRIELDMEAFIRGAREVGVRYHADELIAEVEIAVTWRELIAGLKKFHTEHYKGRKVKIKDIEKISLRTRDTVIRETGMGVPPEIYLKEITEEEKQVMAMGAEAPLWVTRTLQALGRAAVDGDAEQAKASLMAKRGAELDGRRQLSLMINKLQIPPSATVKDFGDVNEEIGSAMLTFHQGARPVEGSDKFLSDGTVEVTVEIHLKPLWNLILHYHKALDNVEP